LIMEKHLTGKIKRPDLEKHIMETNLIGDWKEK
jgi:predicted RNA-binding protein